MLYAFLSVAPLLIWSGQLLLGDYLPALLVLCALLPIAYAISFIPGRVGGRKRDVEVERSSAGSDPNPDRGLRQGGSESERARRAFPLRTVICVVCSLATFLVVAGVEGVSSRAGSLLHLLAMSAICAVILPVTLYIFATDRTSKRSGLVLGVINYIVTGLILYFIDMQELNRVVLALGGAFLMLSALVLNDSSLESGGAYRTKLPKSIRRRNRVMVIGLALVVLIVAFFDDIRLWVRHAGKSVLLAIGRAIAWFGSLWDRGDYTGEMPVEANSDDMGIFFTGGEASPFWLFMEKVLIVVAVLVAAVLLFFIIKKLRRLIVNAFRALMARLGKLNEAISEDYVDERESLLKLDDIKENVGKRMRRLRKMFQREKRYEQLDARERVRYIVRSLYKKSGDASLSTKTVSEALPRIPTGGADPGALAELYDRARYSDKPISTDAADGMRREAGV